MGRKWKRHKLTDIVNFGKYKDDGWTIQDLIDYDLEYLMWVVDNLGWFALDKEVLVVIEEASFDTYTDNYVERKY